MFAAKTLLSLSTLPSTKSRQLFIGGDNETLSVIAMSGLQSKSFAFTIHRRDITQAPTAFLEIVSDDFPLLHAQGSITTEILRRQENFACVRIFYCGPRRKTGHIDVTAI